MPERRPAGRVNFSNLVRTREYSLVMARYSGRDRMDLVTHGHDWVPYQWKHRGAVHPSVNAEFAIREHEAECVGPQ